MTVNFDDLINAGVDPAVVAAFRGLSEDVNGIVATVAPLLGPGLRPARMDDLARISDETHRIRGIVAGQTDSINARVNDAAEARDAAVEAAGAATEDRLAAETAAGNAETAARTAATDAAAAVAPAAADAIRAQVAADADIAQSAAESVAGIVTQTVPRGAADAGAAPTTASLVGAHHLAALPIPRDGRVTKIRFQRASAGNFHFRAFTRSGDVFTQRATWPYFGSYIGVTELDVDLPVLAGDYLGVLVTGLSGRAGGEWDGGMIVGSTATTFTAAGPSVPAAAALVEWEITYEGELDAIKASVDSLSEPSFANRISDGYFMAGGPPLQNAATIADVTQRDLVERGMRRGMIWPATPQFALWTADADPLNRWVFGGFVCYADSPADLLTGAVIYQEGASGALTFLSSLTTGYVDLTPNLRLVWAHGQATAAGTVKFRLGSAASAAGLRIVTGFNLFTAGRALNVQNAVRNILQKAALTETGTGGPTSVGAVFRYGGTGAAESYVEGRLGPDMIRRVFNTEPSTETNRPVFNWLRDYIDGVLVRQGNDDAAPYTIMGRPIGGNHGHQSSVVTVAGHGKTVADQGSIYASGGHEYIIVRVLTADTMEISRTTDTGNPPVAAYTHVRGGANTAGFTVTAAVSGQWYPSFQHRKTIVRVDGQTISAAGDYVYRSAVQITESYEILDKAALVSWWEANAASDTTPQGVAPAAIVSHTYAFDAEGQCTIYTDFLAVTEFPFEKLMMLQAAKSTATQYYVPKALPFTAASQTVDYARKVDASFVSANSLQEVIFTPDRQEASGLTIDRVMAISPGGIHAIGFLPVQDAEPVRRRSITSAKTLRLSGADKIYPSGVDMGLRTTTPGEYYSWVAYRNLFPVQSDRTGVYIVRSNAGAYLYADWHDVAKIDALDLPPDLLGRMITVIEARNAVILTTAATGALRVQVNATGDYGYLVLRLA